MKDKVPLKLSPRTLEVIPDFSKSLNMKGHNYMPLRL